MLLLAAAADKYMAAVALQPSLGPSEHRSVAGRAYAMVASVFEGSKARIWSGRAFDEFQCVEKIDVSRLTAVLKDLERDRALRQSLLSCLLGMPDFGDGMSSKLRAWVKALQRCEQLYAVASAVHENTRHEGVDDRGRARISVSYEYRDPASNGRLFAIGPRVELDGSEGIRVATLQGMKSDLRPALVGEYAHDIDCENSEYRLILSLACKHGISMPCVRSYCAERKAWLEMIANAHNVVESVAKRLPNIVASGGQYRTWLRQIEQVNHVDGALLKWTRSLQKEMQELEQVLVEHEDFAWLNGEKERRLRDGKSASLMPCIVRHCENTVLGIVHRCFFDQHWDVMAKIFDGLIAEPLAGVSAPCSLTTAMRKAEHACLNAGWHVKLVEKPLHGKQEDEIPTVQSARQALAEAKPFAIARGWKPPINESSLSADSPFPVGSKVYIRGYTNALVEEYLSKGVFNTRAR